MKIRVELVKKMIFGQFWLDIKFISRQKWVKKSGFGWI
jgi:hypothetical protein